MLCLLALSIECVLYNCYSFEREFSSTRVCNVEVGGENKRRIRWRSGGGFPFAEVFGSIPPLLYNPISISISIPPFLILLSHISDTYTYKYKSHRMPHKVILDTDPGVDDVLAILLALSSPEIDLALISIVFGNTHAPVAHSNLLKIYHLLAQEVAQTAGAEARYGRLKGQVKTMLAMGEDGPIGGEKAVAAYFVGFE